MIEELSKHPLNSKLALLIRHADRQPIPDGEFGNDVLINEAGKRNAFDFGIKLRGQKINRILTSPIRRCFQTAEQISLGYDNNIDIIVSKNLGDPGIHVENEMEASKFYLQHGPDELYRRFIQHESIPGVVAPKTYYQAMTNFLKQNTTDSGVTLFVTHDTIIAFYAFCLHGRVYTKENWVKYLSGLLLKY